MEIRSKTKESSWDWNTMIEQIDAGAKDSESYGSYEIGAADQGFIWIESFVVSAMRNFLSDVTEWGRYGIESDESLDAETLNAIYSWVRETVRRALPILNTIEAHKKKLRLKYPEEYVAYKERHIRACQDKHLDSTAV